MRSVRGAPIRRVVHSRTVSAGALPEAETVILAIALAGGTLPGHERYLTKLQMIQLCKTWLAEKAQQE